MIQREVSTPGKSPMRSIVCTLAAVALSLHAIFGCCWHHAHAHAGIESDTDRGQVVASREHSHCGHAHEHASQPQSPCDSSDCDDDRCVFVRGDNRAAASTATFNALAVVSPVTTSPPALAHGAHLGIDRAGDDAPPFFAHRVLLI